MLSIKEAYRYANFLNKLCEKINCEFDGNCYSEYWFKTTEKHLKSKACLNAVDEIIEENNDKRYDIDKIKITGIAQLLIDLIDEKLQLALAIEEGKRNTVLDWTENGKNLTLDAAIEYNKNLRSVAEDFLHQMGSQKSLEIKRIGTEYTFNQEGNQVPYKYNVEIVKTIDYDRNIAKKMYKKILSKTDKISTQIEEAMLKEVVNFDPKYDIHDSIEDILENL